MSIIRKYHTHTLQTNPQHFKEGPQNIYSSEIFIRQQQQSNQLPLPLKDDCKTRKKQSNAYQKIRQTQNTHKQWEVH